MVWRTFRPRALCKRNGHLPWNKHAVSVAGFYLCACGRWFPEDDVFDPGVTDDLNLQSHSRYSIHGLLPGTTPMNPLDAISPITALRFGSRAHKKKSAKLGVNSYTHSGQVPLNFNSLMSLDSPMSYLRDNPEELEAIDYLELRRFLIHKMAEWEEGTDVA